jgi:hypothetical protein
VTRTSRIMVPMQSAIAALAAMALNQGPRPPRIRRRATWSAQAGSSITGDRPARRACGFRHGDRRLAISNHIDVSLAGGPPARGNHRNQQVYERRKPAAMASRSEQNQR